MVDMIFQEKQSHYMIFYVFLKKISHQNRNINLKKFKGKR